MKNVVIVQHRLLHYRKQFFESLRAELLHRGIRLDLVHGQAVGSEVAKKDTVELPWATRVHNYCFNIKGRDVIFQPSPACFDSADLVVLMQENRIVSNYPVIISRRFRRRPVAYWGHGKNFQSESPSGVREWWKRKWLCSVDWWFGYTEATKEIVCSSGFPSDRVSVLNNAIDTSGYASDLAQASGRDRSLHRAKYGIPIDAKVGILCGSLYSEKRLDFLVEACDLIKKHLPDFHLLIVGSGPDQYIIEQSSSTRDWIHYAGPRRGIEKAEAFLAADVVLNPGLVGLHILDSFCSGVPMFTTLRAPHSPEFAYIVDGENGVVVDAGLEGYSRAVVDVLNDPAYLGRLRSGCLKSAQVYTLERMVSAFADGIQACLSKGSWR